MSMAAGDLDNDGLADVLWVHPTRLDQCVLRSRWGRCLTEWVRMLADGSGNLGRMALH